MMIRLWNGKEKAGRHDLSAMPPCDNQITSLWVHAFGTRAFLFCAKAKRAPSRRFPRVKALCWQGPHPRIALAINGEITAKRLFYHVREAA